MRTFYLLIYSAYWLRQFQWQLVHFFTSSPNHFITLFCIFHEHISKSSHTTQLYMSVLTVLMKHPRACTFYCKNQKTDDLTILRLPPTLLMIWFEAGDDILNTVTDGVVHRIVWSTRITLETFLLLLHKVIYWKSQRSKGQKLHVGGQTGSGRGFTCR